MGGRGGGGGFTNCFSNIMFVSLLPVAHRSRNTWNGGGWLGGGGGGGGGGRERCMHSQVLLKNGFLTNCLLFGNTKVCCWH